MKKMQRIPLEQRLKKAALAKSGCPFACWLFTDVYFRTLAELSGDTYYQSFYQYAATSGAYDGIEDSFVAQMVAWVLADVSASSSEEAESLLYEILIHPFADGYICEEQEVKKE